MWKQCSSGSVMMAVQQVLVLVCLMVRRVGAQCNEEGVLVDGQCQCLDAIYTGDQCQHLVDHCLQESCSNGGTCRSFAGGFYCECRTDFTGQRCSVADATGTNRFEPIGMFYSHLFETDSAANLLIALRRTGSTPFTLEVTTDNYFIHSVQFRADASNPFANSDNLQAIARQLNMRKFALVPAMAADYLIVPNVTMVSAEQSAMKLLITNTETTDVMYEWMFAYRSYVPVERLGCRPQIDFAQCSSPRNPLSIRLDKTTYVPVIVNRSCGPDSTLSASWHFANYMDTKQLSSETITPSTSIRLPAYSMWFDDMNDPFHLMYVVKIRIIENGRRDGEAFFRCYIQTVLPDPEAIIDGGNYIEHDSMVNLQLNAIDSIDWSLSGRNANALKFSWTCQTDAEPSFCENSVWNGRFYT